MVMNTWLVTGGAGFIGSCLVPQIGIDWPSESEFRQCDFCGSSLSSVRRAEGWRRTRRGRSAGVGPSEGMGHRLVEVFQEHPQFLFQVGDGGEVSATHDLSHHDSKDDFDLVPPGTVFGKVHEPNVVARIRQEFAASGLVSQHARFPCFFPAADSARNASQSTPPTRPTNAR